MSQLAAVLKKAENQKTMDKALLILRSYNFVFFTYETLCEQYPEIGANIDLKHREYSFMLHEDKPMTLKDRGAFDATLILAIRLNGKKNSNIHIYENGEYSRTIKRPWKDAQNILWRKVTAKVKFPDAMTYDERRDWRAENKRVQRAILIGKPIEPSEFYLKWVDKIENLVGK